MRALLSKNKYLRNIYRVSRGQNPLYLDYKIDFKSRWGEGSENPYIERVIAKYQPQYETNLKALATLEPIVRTSLAPESSINWHNNMIPALDALTLMWAGLNARSTYMEVGSGNSTRFVSHALRQRHSKTRIVSIDPQPRADIDSLCDEVVRQPLENIDMSLFDLLESGDTVFIDNSHLAFMNSDVTVFMLEVLPRLKSGVLIGIHDIFLPRDYPQSWSDRGYNEQYLLASMLIANPDYFDIQFANHWIGHRGLHIKPLESLWSVLTQSCGRDVRDRQASAFWAVKR